MTHQEQKDWTENVRWADDRQALRDEFAKAAMQGHIASEYYVLNGDRENYEALAKEFYAFADALMQERERRMKG